jgi:hypothetical protein
VRYYAVLLFTNGSMELLNLGKWNPIAVTDNGNEGEKHTRQDIEELVGHIVDHRRLAGDPIGTWWVGRELL